MEKGLAVQKEVVGEARVDQMYSSAPPDEMHIQKLLSANCFGDNYTAPASTSGPASCSPSRC